MSQTGRTASSLNDANVAGSDGCPECGGEIIQDGVSRICATCGLVVGENAVDRGPEWRQFEGESDTETPRAKKPVDPTRSDNGFDTTIGKQGGRATERNHRLRRADRFSNRTMDTKEKQQAMALTDIKRAGDVLETPQAVSELACILFKQVHNTADHTGKDIDTMCAAAIYAAGRCKEVSLLSSEVCAVFDLESETELFNEVKRLKQMLDLSIPLRRPHHHISKFAADLDAGARTTTLARRLARSIEESEVYEESSPAPSAVAGGIIYVAFQWATWVDATPTQVEVADVADVNKETIVKHNKTVQKADIELETTDLPAVERK